jgi:hypothetical protein
MKHAEQAGAYSRTRNWILRTAATLSLTGSGRAPFLLLLQADGMMAAESAVRRIISFEPTKRPNQDFVTRALPAQAGSDRGHSRRQWPHE